MTALISNFLYNIADFDLMLYGCDIILGIIWLLLGIYLCCTCDYLIHELKDLDEMEVVISRVIIRVITYTDKSSNNGGRLEDN